VSWRVSGCSSCDRLAQVHASSAELLGWLPREHEQLTGVAVPRPELLRAIEQAEAWQKTSMLSRAAS
jgi:hypothetical protein